MRAAGPAVAVALVALAGCGEKRETSTGGASSGSSAPVTVSETEFKLTPASFKVPKAGPLTILVRNDGATAHALALVTPSGEVKTGTLAPGKSQTLKADLKAGKYQIYCPIDGHRGKGMKGVIVVGSGSGGSSGSGGGSSGAGGRSYGGSY